LGGTGGGITGPFVVVRSKPPMRTWSLEREGSRGFGGEIVVPGVKNIKSPVGKFEITDMPDTRRGGDEVRDFEVSGAAART